MDETLVEIGVKSLSLHIQFAGEEKNLVIAAQDFRVFIIFRFGCRHDGFRGFMSAPEVLNDFGVRSEGVERLTEKLLDFENVGVFADDIKDRAFKTDDCAEVLRLSAVHDILKFRSAFFVFGQGEILHCRGCSETVLRGERADGGDERKYQKSK